MAQQQPKPEHRTRPVHDAAAAEQKQLGREVNRDVDPDRQALWRRGHEINEAAEDDDRPTMPPA